MTSLPDRVRQTYHGRSLRTLRQTVSQKPLRGDDAAMNSIIKVRDQFIQELIATSPAWAVRSLCSISTRGEENGISASKTTEEFVYAKWARKLR